MKKLLTSILILCSLTVLSQKKIDQTELMKDLIIWKKSSGKMTGTFWIPNSYWRVALEGNPAVSKESIRLIENSFKEYLILFAIDLTLGNGTNMTFKTKNEIAKSLTVIDINKKKYKPLPEHEINSDAKNLLSNISPMFAQTFGKMGEGLHFFVFKVQNDNGVNSINEFEKGRLTVHHSENIFNWTLPLSAVIDDKYCPIDKEKMNGNWNFCPIHGKELNSK